MLLTVSGPSVATTKVLPVNESPAPAAPPTRSALARFGAPEMITRLLMAMSP
jgi:hypothetical protein